MQKERRYHITKTLLEEYQKYAFENSSELLAEASELLQKKYYSRAYFMGCASLEETGKGYLAFSSKGRNLRSPSVQHTIKEKFEDHSAKIISALIGLLRQKGLTEKNLEYIIKLSVDLKHGREKAMYVDIRENGTVTLPRNIIRPIAAFNCVRLAKDSFDATIKYISSNPPDNFSSFHDKMLCINSNKLKKLMNNVDFWKYYIDMLKNNSSADFVKAIVKYHDEFYCKGTTFSGKSENNS